MKEVSLEEQQSYTDISLWNRELFNYIYDEYNISGRILVNILPFEILVEVYQRTSEQDINLAAKKIIDTLSSNITPFWQVNHPNGFMSNWYPSTFIVDGVTFPTLEHFMMYKKAEIFGDTLSMNKILQASHPMEVKALGRRVKRFSKRTWDNHKIDVVVGGLTYKFEQNPHLKSRLLDTGNSLLVEASPYDVIWGVGLKENDPRINNIATWEGQNLLGFCLMEVRNKLKEKEKEAV